MAKKNLKPVHEVVRKVGRPEEFDIDKVIEQCERMANFGLTHDQMANMMNMNLTTFKDYLARYPEFAPALTRGKEAGTFSVKKSLYERAHGKKITKQVALVIKGKVVKVTLEDEIPGDVKAQTLILLNRDPDNWKNRQEVKLTGSMLNANMSEEEIEERIKKLTEKINPLV